MENFIYPKYQGQSLLNIPSTVLSLFNIPPLKRTLPKKFYQNVLGAEKIIFILADGLGWNLFNRRALKYQFFNKLVKRGILSQITSVFPSSTPPAVNCLNSGLSALEHGLLEWYLYLEETDCIVQSLPFTHTLLKDQDKILDQKQGILFNGKTIYKSLRERSIPSFTICPEELVYSFYNKQVGEGSVILGYKNLSGLFLTLKQKLEEIEGKAYFYVYWPDIDGAEHHFGPWSKEASVEISRLAIGLEKFISQIDKKVASETGLFVSADHGLMEISFRKVVYLDEIEGLRDSFQVSVHNYIILPTGAPRDVYLHIKEDKLKEVKLLLKQKLKGIAEVVETKEMLEKGLFGKGQIHPQFFKRTGNLLILPYNNQAVWYRYDSRDVSLVGQHGGLSADEMLIPFISAKLSDLK